MSASPLLQVCDIGKAFVDGPVPIRALHDINFTVNAGEFVSIIGPSGSGKSTLLRIIGGLIHPDSGDVIFQCRLLKEPQSDIGFVFQTTNLMPWRTVIQNVLLPIEIQNGRSSAQDADRAVALLQILGLEGFESVYPKHLSGGMAQRVVLARTLIQQPKLLLMDEPFGSLDALTRERMNLELLRVHNMHSMTVLMVTHSIPEAVFLADRVIVLSERPGRIVCDIPITLPHPRTVEHTATAEYAALTLQIRTQVGITPSTDATTHQARMAP